MRNALTLCFVTTPLAAASAQELPRRIKFLNWGQNPNANGKLVVLGETARRALAHPLNAWKRVALDFEHNTLPGTAAYEASKEPRDVAGYGDVAIIPGDGAYLDNITYTPAGLAAAPNYAGVSGGPVCAANGDVLTILSVALVRNSAVPGMVFKPVPLSAGAAGQVEQIIQAQEPTLMKHKDELCRLLGLDPATATDEQIAAALKTRADKAEADAAAAKAEAEAAEAAAKAAKPAEGTPPEVTPLAAQVAAAVGIALKPLADQIGTVRAEFDKRDKAAVLADARAAGKVVALTADAVAVLTVAQLRKVVEVTPVTVPLSARTPEHIQETTRAAGPTAEQATIARNCGMDPDKVWPKATGGFVSIRTALAIAAVVCGLGAAALFAADRDTPESEGLHTVITAGEAIGAGNLAGVWTNGLVYAATTAKSLTIIGRVERAVAAGEATVIKRGTYLLANGDGIAAANIGATCYVWTNTAFTVAKTPLVQTNVAGTVTDVTDSGVWVRVGL